MHDCERFREDLTERMLGEQPPGPPEILSQELNSCEDCQSFYRDALALIEIIDNAGIYPSPPTMSEAYTADFVTRLRPKLVVQAPLSQSAVKARSRRNPLWTWSLAAGAAAAVLALIFVVYSDPSGSKPSAPSVSTVQIEDEPIHGVDPGTIEFLGQSELFLRTFVKIEPTDFAELEDARNRARLQLAGLNQRKDAVVNVVPVHAVLDDYETVLRDIGNMDQSSAEDIADVQGRIERNGLIANMKAYQPRIVLSTSRK